MRQQTDEKLMIRYLLGALSEEERLAIEERFFVDDEYYTQLRAVQEELVDSYLRGELSNRERELFETRLLKSPQMKKRVEFASTLNRAFSEIESSEPRIAARPAATSWWESLPQSLLAILRAQGPAFKFALASAAFLLALGAFWMAIENRRMSAQVAQLQEERKAVERRLEELGQQLSRQNERSNEADREIKNALDAARHLQKERDQLQEQLNNLQSLQAVVSFVLAPGLDLRTGNEPTKLIVPRTARSIELQLDLEGEESYRSYRAELRTAGGNLVWSRDMLQVRPTSYGKAVLLNLPAAVVDMGEYELALKGVSRGQLETVGYYYFIVTRR